MSRYLKGFFVFWAVNLVFFFAIASYLGGDALNGKVIDGHYFLGAHGHFTEVNHGVFVYSEVHAILFLILGAAAVPLAIIARRQKTS